MDEHIQIELYHYDFDAMADQGFASHHKHTTESMTLTGFDDERRKDVARMLRDRSCYAKVAQARVSRGASDIQVLEAAYAASQNIDSSWCGNPFWSEVFEAEGCAGNRSTSIGDIATLDGKAWICCRWGWDPL